MQLQMFHHVQILKCIQCGNVMLEEGDLEKLAEAGDLLQATIPPPPGFVNSTIVPEPGGGASKRLDTLTPPDDDDRPYTFGEPGPGPLL